MHYCFIALFFCRYSQAGGNHYPSRITSRRTHFFCTINSLVAVFFFWFHIIVEELRTHDLFSTGVLKRRRDVKYDNDNDNFLLVPWRLLVKLYSKAGVSSCTSA